MRLNFILIFALITTTFTTLIFALSSVIGENIVKHQIGSFFERELIEDYRIDNFHFDGLHISFGININDNEVAKVVGSISLKDFIIKLNFKMINIKSKWIKKFKDIGTFSSSGDIKITLFGTRINTILVTKEETIKFRYRKKFVTKTRYLDIQNSSISMDTFNKLTGLNLIGNRVNLDGELIGDRTSMSGDINISLDNNLNMVGELEYSKDSIIFQGYSEELNGEVNLNITKDEQILLFTNVMIDKLFEIFKIRSNLHGKGDMLLDYSGNSINFQGECKRISFNKNQTLSYINDILNLNIDKNMFEEILFEGEIENSSIIFNLQASNSGVDFKIDDGIYDINRKRFYFESKISLDSNNIASIFYRSKTATAITIYDSGENNFKEFIVKNSKNSNYQQEIQSLIQLY